MTATDDNVVAQVHHRQGDENPSTAASGQTSDVPSLQLEDLYREHSAYVAGVAIRILGHCDDIEDLVQDVFLSAHRGLRDVRNPAAIRGWLATVAARRAARHLRVRKLKRFVGLDDTPDYHQTVAKGASPEQKAMLVRVYQALESLPAKKRVAWTLRYIEGEKLQTVADACGWSLATTKRRLSEAHDTIRRMVDDG